ncbi:MAG TPA: DUF2336 domain-containing protein [Patescibacteria group bacterium]|nr:DUF2336 domain-containing protein [Patescibacteria group bacterium]
MLNFLRKVFGKKKRGKPIPVLPARPEDIVLPDLPDVAGANDDPDIRIALAHRLVTLLPGMETDEHSQLYAYAVQALMSLAQDEVVRVRQALSTALRDYAKAPPAVVARLARDVEREIAEPILRRCVALEEGVLVEILSGHPEPWAIAAIAARPSVTERISDAVFKTGDIKGTALLLANKGAAISEATLREVVAGARQHAEWHGPLAMSPHLSVDSTREITGFVNDAILEVLETRSDLDAPTRNAVVAIVGRRLAYTRQTGKLDAREKVEHFARAGSLNAELVHDALAWQERAFALHAIARLSGVAFETVERMVAAGSKPIIALCWKAQLPARMCVDVQRFAGRVQPRDLLYPKGGTEYPLSPEEIAWQLEFFGIKK